MRRWLLAAALLALLAVAAAQGAGDLAGGDIAADAAVAPFPDALADGNTDTGSEQQLIDASPQPLEPIAGEELQPADPTAEQPPADPSAEQQPGEDAQPTENTTATEEQQAGGEQMGDGSATEGAQAADDAQQADDGTTAEEQQQAEEEQRQAEEEAAAQQSDTYAADGTDGSTAETADGQGDGMWQYIPPAPSPPAADPPVAVPSPSPSPSPELPPPVASPPPPAPPAPISWPVNVVVLIDGVEYPFTDEKAAQVATALQMITPAFKWTAAAQQPFYYGKLPDMPPENSTATNTSTTAGPMQMVPVSGTTAVVPAALYPTAPITTAPAVATAPTAAPDAAAYPTATTADATAAAVADPAATAVAIDPTAATAAIATDPAAAAAAATAAVPIDATAAAAAAAVVPAAATAGAVPAEALSAAADGSQLVSVDPLAINGLGGTGGRKMMAKPEGDGDGGKPKKEDAQGDGKKVTKQDEKKEDKKAGGDGDKKAAAAPAPATAAAAAAAAGDGADAAAAENLPLATEKGQCYSKKHALAPDEAGCALYCEAKVASGEVKEEELSVYFYANKRSPNGAPNCCTCVKAAGNNTTAGAAKDNAETNTTDATGDTKAGSGDNETKAGDGNEDDGSGDKKGSKGGSDDGSKKNNEEEEGGKKKGGEDDEKKGTRPGNYTRNNATAPAKPVTPAGVYLFAQTFITNFTEEQALNASIRLASKNGVLLSNLHQAAGLSAKSVDIVFLGSGPYQFTPLPFKYVRPAAAADEATAVEAEASSGTSNGTLIGIILGAVCGVVLLVAIASAFAIRRHRMKKQDGQALVRKWEAERRCAEESRRAAMEERRAASQRALDKVLSKDGKSASSRPPRSTSSVTASSSSQPSASNSLDRMRAVLGLRRDHLAAAAARMDAAEAAAAASSARRVPSIAGSDVATPLQAADFNASSGRPSPAPSVVSEATQGSSQGSEAPLTSVVVRQTGAASSSAAPAPSWATRDPGQAPKKGGFWTFGRS